MIIDGKKYYHVFTAGSYPQGNFSVQDVFNMAFYYSPKFREACFWIGHQPSTHMGNEEPAALAWVNSLTAIGDRLYIDEFSFISERLKQLVKDKSYKYVSIELSLYELLNKTQFWYPTAFGLTNRPQVDQMEPLEFDEDAEFTGSYERKSASFTFTEKFDESRVIKKAVFTFQLHNFNNQNSNQMNEFLKKIAEGMGINVAKFVTEDALSQAITKTFTDKNAEVTNLGTKITELENKINGNAGSGGGSAELTEAEKRVLALEERAAVNLVEQAVKDKKILPKDKESYIALAKSDFTNTEKAIGAMGVHSTLSNGKINDDTSKVDMVNNPKLKKADGTILTYTEVKKKPSLIAQHGLTPEDLEQLKKAENSK